MPSRRYGDTTGTLSGRQAGGNQFLTAAGLDTPEPGGYVYLFGDAQTMTGQSRGGHDVLLSADNQAPIVVISGDAWVMQDQSAGGSDVIRGTSFRSFGNNYLQGDAGNTMSGQARGGADIVVGGNGAGTDNFILAGDTFAMSGEARGGNDLVIGGTDATNNLYGDAYQIQGQAQGGNDILHAGNGLAKNTLFGDAGVLHGMAGGVRGGHDLLVGSAAGGTLHGDARNAAGLVTCGNDCLVSGSGNEVMWGDAGQRDPGATVVTGADVFAFAPGNGHDAVRDFEPGKDRIDLTAFAGSGLHGFAGLSLATGGGNTVIALPGGGTVTLTGVTALAAADVLFA